MRDQQNEPLNDDLAREIERALAVEPSPEFQARIRARVAGETVSRTGGGWWGRAASQAAFTVVAGVVLIVSVLWFGREPRDQQAQIGPPVQRSIPPAPLADGGDGRQPVVSPVRPATDERRTRVHVSDELPTQVAVDTVPSHRDPFSDVLVSASEVRAVRQLAALLSPEDVLKAPPPSSRPEEINELVIAPIAVAPIQLRPIEGEAE